MARLNYKQWHSLDLAVLFGLWLISRSISLFLLNLFIITPPQNRGGVTFSLQFVGKRTRLTSFYKFHNGLISISSSNLPLEEVVQQTIPLAIIWHDVKISVSLNQSMLRSQLSVLTMIDSCGGTDGFTQWIIGRMGSLKTQVIVGKNGGRLRTNRLTSEWTTTEKSGKKNQNSYISILFTDRHTPGLKIW